MRGRTAVLLATVAMLAVACGREGPIVAPAPIALPTAPVRDERPVVWTSTNGPVRLRVVMTPRRPVVGDLVRFDIKMSYGDPPYRPGFFAYRLAVGDQFVESAMAACGAPPSGAKPASPRPFDDNMHRTTRVFTPGRRTFSLSAHPGCAPRLPGVSIERTYDVIGSRPTSGMHRTGADATRQVDVLVAPAGPKEWQAVHVFAIFEDRTGEPFGWRVSFGDGRRRIFGGPSCKPGGTRPDGRY